jgi:hypothetical protein
LPAIIDPQDSQFDLQVQLDEKYFGFDSSLQKITQVKIFDSPSNQTVKFKLNNALNVSAVYSMKIQFVCPDAIVVANYTFKSPNITESKVKVQNPAKIASISRGGLVDVRFYLDI